MKAQDNTWSIVFSKLGTSPMDILNKIAKHLVQRRKLISAIENAYHELEGKIIVEIGCGTAIECHLFSIRGARCLGVDREFGALKYADEARKIFKNSSSLCQGDGFSIPVKSESADIVLSQGFLEHFTPPQSANLLKEQARILKKGGLLIVDVPNLHSIYEIYKKVYAIFGPWIYGQERGIKASEIIQHGKKNGLLYLTRYGWSFKGYPFRYIFEFLYMIPMLCVRNVLLLFGKCHDSIGIILKKG